MSALSAGQRADLVRQTLPVAAHLAALVHGDGGPEDIAEVLGGLDDAAKNALIVTLAGMVDLERPVGRGLSWTAVTTHGALPVSAWMEQRPLREHADTEQVEELGEDFVDWAAVARFLKGFRGEVTDAEFLAAVRQCTAAGGTLEDVDQLRGWPAKTAENWVNRLRKRYQRAGREFPSLAAPVAGRKFTEEEVVRIRQRSADGATDLEIAMSYGCDRRTVSAICRGQRYPQFGGPIRTSRHAQGVQASRNHMCGHGASSKAALKRHQVGAAA